jgi:hypothetical protein
MVFKRILIIAFFILFNSSIYPQIFSPGQAQGLFMTVGVGPKIPIGDFSDSHNIGVGFDFTFSYTDNNIAPLFVYTKIGYEHFPGKQNFYKTTNHSSISSNVIFIYPGARIFLPPIIDQQFLLMPVVEVGASWAWFQTYNQFKIDSGISNFTEDDTKWGMHMGAGVSMFLLDVMVFYNYFHNHQYLSFDLRLRIPIFVKV